jgi:pimeloyl-ACP methyl ester carboxylesterase
MKKLKKAFKILGGIFFIGFTLLYIAFYTFTGPKADASILEEFEDASVRPIISQETFRGFEYRKISITNHDSLPTLVFVHGTIGSCIDFIAYIKDTTLSKKANFISYDRVGYNYKDKNEVQESIAFETEMLQDVTLNLIKEKTILVGCSFGGPIVLTDTTQYKKVILLAPAVYSKVEPMPWMLNVYKWKAIPWLLPPIWQQASKEKTTHKKDLLNFEESWIQNPTKIIGIHGDADAIVPYSNSVYLKEQFSKDQFDLITIPNAGYGLVWSEFDFIKQQFLKQLD